MFTCKVICSKSLLKQNLLSSSLMKLSKHKHSVYNVVKLNKGFIKLKDSDCFSYMQSFISNDLRLFDLKRSLYTYLLNINTRILADLFLYKLNGEIFSHERELILHGLTRHRYGHGGNENDELLLECDRKLLKPVYKTLFAAKLRKKVHLEMAPELSSWIIFPSIKHNSIEKQFSSLTDDDDNNNNDCGDDKSSSVEFNEIISNEKIFVKDARLDNFGFRFITSEKIQSFQHLIEQLKSNINAELIQSSEREYIKYRYQLGMPEGYNDLGHSIYFPWECNGDILNAISCKKGFYVGEKNIDRVRKRYKLHFRALPISFQDNNQQAIEYYNLQRGTILLSQQDDEKSIGRIIKCKGKFGLALIKTNFLNSKEKTYNVFHRESLLQAKIHIPNWWLSKEKFQSITNSKESELLPPVPFLEETISSVQKQIDSK